MNYHQLPIIVKARHNSRLFIWILLFTLFLFITLFIIFNDHITASLSNLTMVVRNPERTSPNAHSFAFMFNEIKNMEDWSTQGDKVWDAFFPDQKSGFLWVVREETAATEPWGVSMFHGLHCLKMIRETLVDTMRVPETTLTHHMDMDMDHISHCFTYLLQVQE
jgi:hypothetical protein